MRDFTFVCSSSHCVRWVPLCVRWEIVEAAVVVMQEMDTVAAAVPAVVEMDTAAAAVPAVVEMEVAVAHQVSIKQVSIKAYQVSPAE